ncbi:MAG: integration host factor subunit alpha [Desulfobacteraceae bacterium]|nr:MAG: integration host factor subunit alpha [Desulfobacteraceae bacterium]
MTLTKDTIVQSLHDELAIARADAQRNVDIILEKVKETLTSGEDLLISGFGKFLVNSKGTRRGRNPATGESLILDARKVVTFRCSPVLRRKLNRDDEDS